MSIPVLLPTLAARFAWIIGIMMFDQPRELGKNLPAHPLLNLARLRLRRLRDRFAAILARAQAGTLRASPRREAGKPLVQRLTWPRPPRVLPSGYMWMAKVAPWTSNGGWHVLTLVTYDAEMRALIEAAPQLKPLLRAILLATYTRTRDMPEILREPVRVRTPRRRAPRAAVLATATPAPARPPMPRPGYRPSCKWPKGVLTPRPRSRGKLRHGTKPPLPD